MIAGHDFIAELFEDLDARADEVQSGLLAGAGEIGVLREEAVAGMDGIDFVLPRQSDDAGDVEIGADRLAGFADAIGFIGFEAMQGKAVFVRVNRHRADAQLRCGAENADGNLAAVGNEQLANWAQSRLWFLRHGGSVPSSKTRSSLQLPILEGNRADSHD